MENKALYITFDRELTESELTSIYEVLEEHVTLKDSSTLTESDEIVNSMTVNIFEGKEASQSCYEFPLNESLTHATGDAIANALAVVLPDDFVMEYSDFKQ